MLVTVKDETELPEDGIYVRVMSKPTVLSGPKFGHNYQRADGKPWKDGGYDRRNGHSRRCVSNMEGADIAEKEVEAYYKEA